MSEEALRIDIWLWRARFFKTRAIATDYAAKGRIRIGTGDLVRRIEKPASQVRPGDVLTFRLRSRIVSLKIESLGERRGPAAEARELYTLTGEEDDRHV
ncbi:RNA-binding S4 domain-containing protein [Hyphobacterium sp.]|uniref:RNA-binding S4 domain-containing protein n=1 Tax=Hyphobacterium sp. TaxID=2004662 RepID=UPI003BAA380B